MENEKEYVFMTEVKLTEAIYPILKIIRDKHTNLNLEIRDETDKENLADLYKRREKLNNAERVLIEIRDGKRR